MLSGQAQLANIDLWAHLENNIRCAHFILTTKVIMTAMEATVNTEHSDPIPFRNSTLHRALSNIKFLSALLSALFSHPIIVAYCFTYLPLGDMIDTSTVGTVIQI